MEDKKHPLDIDDKVALDELFQKDPAFITDEDMEKIVHNVRRARAKWAAKDAKKAERKTAKKAPKKTPAEAKALLDALDIKF